MDVTLPDNGGLLRDIIANKCISTLFQPIVDLKSAEIIGYEALSRGPAGTSLHSPLSLIAQAEADGLIWQLEELFREKAIVAAKGQSLKNLLFLNVDPNVVNDPSFFSGFTRQSILDHGLMPEMIVFEITERSAIESYKSFRSAMLHYIEQGYKTAIDDTGAGYSNLSMINKIKPNFIKIDMDLIRGVDADSFKQAIIKSFVWLANLTNIQLVAEGIETMEEARTLHSLGVHAGQGYLLGRPSPELTEIDTNVRRALMNLNRSTELLHSYSTKYIGEICEPVSSFDAEASCSEVKQYLDANDIEGACIQSNGHIVGLIMRSKLNAALSVQYGFSLHARKPVKGVMEPACLTVDYFTPISTVSELALARPHARIYDNIIVTRNFKYAGIISVINMMKHSLEIERSYALALNPLTGLPGNVQINKVLYDTIRNGNECCVLYIDVDNFKIYNDAYGFKQGDTMLILAKDAICGAVKSRYSFTSFIGHIGGDDFLAVVDCGAAECEALCASIISGFNQEVRRLFCEKDLARGYIMGQARDFSRKKARYPLNTLSIAALRGCMSGFETPDKLARRLSELKSAVKALGGGRYRIITSSAHAALPAHAPPA
jgi:EAL domain-containing protein (putative c-di-GMP-specific phosphodiesterase class I)/GGDEF domain-containing protein